MGNNLSEKSTILEIVSSKSTDANALAKEIRNYGVDAVVTNSLSLQRSKVLLYKYKEIIHHKYIDQIGSSNIINLHSGKLPEYRGLHTLSWMIQNGESDGYLTLHEVEQKVDTGAIISELNFKIEKNMDVNDAHKIITMALKEWVPQEVVKWLNNEKKPISMEPYTLFKIYPEKKDNNFFNSKWRLNESINLVRAVNPPYGPGAIYQGDRRTVRVAVPFSKTSSKHIEKNSIGKINLKLDDGFMACYMLPISK